MVLRLASTELLLDLQLIAWCIDLHLKGSPVMVHPLLYNVHYWINRTALERDNSVTARALWSNIAWWRHQMETFSALLAICAGNSPVPGEFPTQRPVTRSFDVFFDLRLNKQLSKQSRGWWFETLSRSLWRHRNGLLIWWYIQNIRVVNHGDCGHINVSNAKQWTSWWRETPVMFISLWLYFLLDVWVETHIEIC